MENLVPLGTGNSRLMKSNIPSNTTLAQLIQMWNNGTFPYDIGPLNSAGISQQGTPLNKDTLLADVAAGLFKLYGADATPNKAFEYLGKFNLHWWKKRTASEYKEKRELLSSGLVIAVSILSIQCSNSIDIDDSGKVTLHSPETITVTQQNVASLLKNKYFYSSVDGVSDTRNIYYMESSVTVSFNGDELSVKPLYKVTSELVTFSDVSYVQSTDRSAYPDSGEQDGYEYQYLGVPFENLPNSPQIETGSYTGTGTSGASNKVVLRLPFPAKALFVSMVPVISGSGDYDYYEIMFLKGNQTKEYFSSSKYFAMNAESARGSLIYVTFDDTQNIVKWYSPNGAAAQLNMSGFVYNYLAIG